MKNILFFIILSLFVSSCAAVETSHPADPTEITARAMDLFNRGRYTAALVDFQQVRDFFPFSQYSLLAELKSADCYFFKNEMSEALVLYEEFESKHPTNEAMPYVLFQIGMCHYKRIDTIDRDPGSAHSAIGIFTRLIRTYPRSSYVAEAKVRINAAREFLARHELYVAKFYLRTGEWEAALNRLEQILVQYPNSVVAAEAQPLLEEVRVVGAENDGRMSIMQRFKLSL